VFGASPKSDQYWDMRMKKKLLKKFPRSLSVEETRLDYNLKKVLDALLCNCESFPLFPLLLLLYLTGIRAVHHTRRYRRGRWPARPVVSSSSIR
jgi:hypothetical protein